MKVAPATPVGREYERFPPLDAGRRADAEESAALAAENKGELKVRGINRYDSRQICSRKKRQIQFMEVYELSCIAGKSQDLICRYRSAACRPAWTL